MPDQCKDILAGTVFDTIVSVSQFDSHEQMISWLMTVDWEEFKSKQDAGLKVTLPIEGVMVPNREAG